MDSGRESILEVGRERARERGGQRGHHGFFCAGTKRKEGGRAV